MRCEGVKTMVNENKKKVSGWTVAIYVFFCFMVVVYLAPIIWVVLSSLKTRKELIKTPFALPTAPQWENYTFAWTAGKLGVAMRNSFIVCVVTLLLTMLVGSMAAFAIGKMRWKLANATMTYILVGMMIPVHCVLIPLFVRFAKIGLSDSLIGIIIPYLTFSLAGDDFHHDRLLPEYPERAVRVGLYRRMLHLQDVLQHRASAFAHRPLCHRPYDLRQ